MKTYIKITLVLSLFFFDGCQTRNSSISSGSEDGADTVVTLNQLVIKYHHTPDAAKLPFVMETSTIMITDSMLHTEKYNILIHDAKYDSVNYMNCVNNEGFLPVKFYSLDKNILKISIYYVNQPYWYFEGGIEVNGKNEIILKRGRHRTIGANALRAMFSELTFKIFIPKQFNLSRIKYECPIL